MKDVGVVTMTKFSGVEAHYRILVCACGTVSCWAAGEKMTPRHNAHRHFPTRTCPRSALRMECPECLEKKLMKAGNLVYRLNAVIPHFDRVTEEWETAW